MPTFIWLVLDCEGKSCEPWRIIESYAPIRLEDLETIKGFYDCGYYKDKYYAEFTANPKDCDLLTTVYSRLKWGGCTVEDTALVALNAAFEEHCKVEDPVATSPAKLGTDALRNGEYLKAIEYYEELLANEENTLKTHHDQIMIAKVRENDHSEITTQIDTLIPGSHQSRFQKKILSNLNQKFLYLH